MFTSTRTQPFVPKAPSDIAAVKNLDFLPAQEYCDFVVFKPELPTGYTITEKSLRPETPESPATYHCIIQGPDGLEFSIKQFNFSDIESIAAYDHPNLWKCDEVVAKREDFADKFEIKAHVFGGANVSLADNIIWLGYNYKAQPQKSLTTQLMRTNIEMTLRKGEIDDATWLQICRSLTVVDAVLAARINQTSFAELCWKSRYAAKAGNVPISYWKYQRPNDFAVTMYAKRHLPANKLCAQTCPLQIGDYELNSAIHFSKDETTQEIEYIYQHKTTLGSYLRLLISPEMGSIAVPPEPSNQVCHTETLQHNKTPICLTNLNEKYGMHGAAWTNGKLKFMLFAKPASWTDKSWFKSLSTQLVDYSYQMQKTKCLQRVINPWSTTNLSTTLMKTSVMLLATGIGLYAGYKYMTQPTANVQATITPPTYRK